MSLVDLETATDTFDCKIPDCPREARSNRGRYAFLCDVHVEEARATFSAQIRAGMARKAVEGDASATESRLGGLPEAAVALSTSGLSVPENGSAPSSPLPSISEVADRIPALARRVEEKLLHRRAAREEATDSIRALNAVLGELREAVQALS